MQQEEFDMPRRVSHLASIVKKTGETTVTGPAKAVLVRLPVFVLAEVDALATMAGKSRNSMVCHLLQAAIEEVRAELDLDTVTALNEATTQHTVAFLADGDHHQEQF